MKRFYDHVAICICRSGNLRSPSHRPFFCDPKFYPSPPKPWRLPSYANDVANELAEGSYRTFRPKELMLSDIEYVDFEAVESENEGSSDADSTDSKVSVALSDNCDFDDMD